MAYAEVSSNVKRLLGVRLLMRTWTCTIRRLMWTTFRPTDSGIPSNALLPCPLFVYRSDAGW